jgi:SAM-dependent methyltransferase
MNKEFWNERYAEHESVYGATPNEFFKEQLGNLPPGKILLPAEGEGRNAIYAASLGWQVTAFDFSEVAKTKTLKLAADLGITTIDYKVQDLSALVLEEEEFDAVALIYVHLPGQVRRHLIHECIKSLKPGGKLIMEVFSKEQLQYTSGGPKDETMLYSRDMAAELFKELKIVCNEEVVENLSEGPFHSGLASIVRLVAIK